MANAYPLRTVRLGRISFVGCAARRRRSGKDLRGSRYCQPDACRPDPNRLDARAALLLSRDGIQGLWRQRLNEEQPQLVKGLEDEEIYQFARSFDGKNLAYSTGARMREIIFMENVK